MEKILRKLILRKRLAHTDGVASRIDGSYRCFGEIDELEILKCSEDTNIWEDSVVQINSDYHDQLFYVARQERKCDRQDATFWSENSHKHPHVLLVSFVHLSSNQASVWMNVIREIENTYPEVIGYFALEQSDLILFIKGQTYEECDKIITKIRYKAFSDNTLNVTYSYSIPAILANAFEDDNKIALYSEELSKVDILVSAKSNHTLPENSKDFVNALSTCVSNWGGTCVPASRFGDYDIQVEIAGIKMSHLLFLHKKGELLCHTNKLYGDVTYNCITKIHTPVNYASGDTNEGL